MLLALVLSTTCAAQQAVSASEKYHKTYNVQSQYIIDWNEDMTVPVDSVHVLEYYEEAKRLPDMERRLKIKVSTDLMREAREPKIEQ